MSLIVVGLTGETPMTLFSGFLVTSPLGFKARVGSALFAIFAEAGIKGTNIQAPHHRFTSGATLADLLAKAG